MIHIPEHLPLLSAGAHLDPADGACLMEVVSVLAGEPFTDRPRCTDPMLATVARMVNDAMSDGARHRLMLLAPELIGTRATDRRGAPMIVAACLREVAAYPHVSGRGRRRLHRRLRAALRRLGRRTPGPLGAALYRHGPATHALSAAVCALRALPVADRDRALERLLHVALAARPPVAHRRSTATMIE